MTGACRGAGDTLIGALVMGVGAPVVGFGVGLRFAGDHCGACAVAESSVGDGEGGAGGGGASMGSPTLRVGSVLVAACGSTEVGCAGGGGAPVGDATSTIGTATAADAAVNRPSKVKER